MSKVQHSEACCTLPPFTGSDYKPTGTIERIQGTSLSTRTKKINESGTDIDIYLTGKKDAEIAIICIYGTLTSKAKTEWLTIDIFGIQNPTQQGADILAAQLGARVAMPDFFKGKPWETSKFPPPNRDEFLAWIGATQWPQVEPILLKTIGFLREDGAKKFGTPSHCQSHPWTPLPNKLCSVSCANFNRFVWFLLGRKNGISSN